MILDAQGKIIGMIDMKEIRHISLFFFESSCQRQDERTTRLHRHAVYGCETPSMGMSTGRFGLSNHSGR